MNLQNILKQGTYYLSSTDCYPFPTISCELNESRLLFNAPFLYGRLGPLFYPAFRALNKIKLPPFSSDPAPFSGSAPADPWCSGVRAQEGSTVNLLNCEIRNCSESCVETDSISTINIRNSTAN